MALRNIIYSDLNSDKPTESPLVYNLDSISQSLTDLISLRRGEILFNPDKGLNLEDELFELVDDLSALILFNNIVQSIETYIPIVELDYANSRVVANLDENAFEIIILYSVKGLQGKSFSYSAILENNNA